MEEDLKKKIKKNEDYLKKDEDDLKIKIKINEDNLKKNKKNEDDLKK